MIQIIDVKENKNIDKFNSAAKDAYYNPEKHGLLIKIYADWCGHCQTMTAEWDRLIHDLKTNYICKKPGCVLTIANIQAVNLEVSDPVIQNLKYIPKDIQSIPTIMYVNKGERGLEYFYERVYSDMLKWIVGHEKFALVRKTTNNNVAKDYVSNSSKRLRNITNNAHIKFKLLHRNTLKRFHKEMKRKHKKSVKSRMPTPIVYSNQLSRQFQKQHTQKYVPGYLRDD